MARQRQMIVPYRMNRTLAADYAGVSVDKFDEEVRPFVTESSSGKGSGVYFLRSEIEKRLDRIHEKNLVSKDIPRRGAPKTVDVSNNVEVVTLPRKGKTTLDPFTAAKAAKLSQSR